MYLLVCMYALPFVINMQLHGDLLFDPEIVLEAVEWRSCWSSLHSRALQTTDDGKYRKEQVQAHGF
jgi:hypothetical protein